MTALTPLQQSKRQKFDRNELNFKNKTTNIDRVYEFSHCDQRYKQQIAQKTESSTEEKEWWTEGKADGSNETAINKQINERNREREGRKIGTSQLQKAMNVALVLDKNCVIKQLT